MSDIGQAATPQVVDRKELLAQQFNDAEQTAQTDVPAKVATAVIPAAGERVRDETGKFLPKAAAATISVAASAGPVVQTPIVEPAWNKPPASWKKDKHPLWAAMTPDQREYAFQREEQMKAGIEPLLPRAELADKLTKAAEPYMNTIRGLGLELPQAVAGLMKVDHDLRTLPYDQKLAMLSQVARGYGIDLSGQMQNVQQAFDPNVQAIQNELLAIKGQFSSFTQQQEAAAQRAAADEIQKFSKTAEHFEEVKPVMAQLLNSGMADDIQDAYTKAIRLNPDLFDQMQTARQAASDVEKRKAADDAAKRAKAAAVSVKSATPGIPKATNAQDRRSMLAEQFGNMSERL